MPAPLLSLHEVEAHYGRVCALSGVSLQVAAGRIVALLGANGAGKTTTLRVISALLRPTRGHVEFDGRRVDQLRADQLVRAGIAHVPEGRQIFPDLTVRENLRLGAYTRGAASRGEGREGAAERPGFRLIPGALASPRSGVERVPDHDPLRPPSEGSGAGGPAGREMERIFEYFPRLRERLAQRAGTLSGGEQQMLAIGRALMSQPRLLLLDEPSLGLAPLLVKEIFRIIGEIREAGTTVVLVEQNVHMALAVADTAYLLETGRVVLSDTSAALRQREEVKRAYLGI
jgi:branched-chain amino acid transport system ATP-binding protein